MNSRERFLEVMNFNTNVRSMKWEFGYWGENITQWYQEGLPKKVGTNIPTNLTTVAASLYTTAWTHEWRKHRKYYDEPDLLKDILGHLTTVNELLKTGGYVPTGDHCISPGVSWENFKYYRHRLNEIIDANGAM